MSFQLLERVRVLVEVQGDDGPVSAGSVGTILHIYAGAVAYEVEFDDHNVATAEAEKLERAT